MLRLALIVALATTVVVVGVAKAENKILAGPYFMPLDNDPQSIDDIVQNSGIKHFIFAFVLAPNSGECIPTWDGLKGQLVEQDQHVHSMINKVREHGGDVSISFGGYNGVELGHACGSAQELAAAYQKVIDKYQLTHVDFDIEGDDLGAVVEEAKRFEAIKILKSTAHQHGKELHVTLTMPCTTVGLSDLGKAEIQRAISVGAEIDLYKIMAFDYGGNGGSMGSSVTQVMETIHQQLKQLRTDLHTDQQVYQHIGMILMNGHTDQSTELFTQQTFDQLVQYAKEKHLGRVSFWALNRDRPCPQNGKPLGWVAGICSSIPQQPYDFSKIVAKFANNHWVDPVTNPTTPTGPPHPTDPHPHTTTTTGSPVVVDCSNTHGEQYFPYANDCHKYVRCYGGVMHVLTCPAGTIYDIGLHICNWEADVHRPECK